MKNNSLYLKTNEDKNSTFINSLKNGIAGLIAYFSSGLLYPLELIKIRLQVREEKKFKMSNLIKDIYTKEGIRGFYRGFYFSIFAGGVANILFFSGLEYLNYIFENKTDNYTIKKQIITSYIAGLTASIITLPIWTLRTRISLVTLDKIESKYLKNRIMISWVIIKESLQKEGVFHLYKGLTSSIFLSINGGVIMTVYETGKRMMLKNSKNMKIENYQGAILGVISKVISSCLLYPFNVIRSKQQQFKKSQIQENILKNTIVANNDYGLFPKAIKTIFKNQGVFGFYKGLLPSLLRHIPNSSLFFYSYELSLKILNKN